MKVFWSWQGDRTPKNHHYFVRDALQGACDQLAAEAEVDEGERPEVDHDTKGVAGTPDIVKAIAEKIDAASAFVADMTPVALTDPASLRPDLDTEKLPKPKHVQNANVMSELGYAEKAVGLDRIILVANAAHYPGPDALPFDWRNRRGPITYNLADDADSADRKAEQASLASKLREPLRLILEAAQPAVPLLAPLEAEPDDVALWKGAAKGMEVNEGILERGLTKVLLEDGPRLYVKITPSGWRKPSLATLENQMRVNQAALSVRGSHGTSGKNGDGAFSAWGIYEEPGVGYRAATVTQWFQASGVFWAVDTSSFGLDEHGQYFAFKAPFPYLARFIDAAMAALDAVGASGPFTVELGASNLKGVGWPSDLRSRRAPALKSTATATMRRKVFTTDDRNKVLWDFWNELADAFGFSAARSFGEFQSAAAVQLSTEETAA
jgi:hypothetical protein